MKTEKEGGKEEGREKEKEEDEGSNEMEEREKVRKAGCYPNTPIKQFINSGLSLLKDDFMKPV